MITTTLVTSLLLYRAIGILYLEHQFSGDDPVHYDFVLRSLERLVDSLGLFGL
jgi:hypothetical protein